MRINRLNAAALLLYHAVAALAVWPWLFSWTGIVAAFVGIYVFGTLGINLCYHRLLTHRGLVCPKWLEHTLAILGVCSFQDTPARWVAIHRRHHEHPDRQPDPHSPLVSFFWGHMEWIYTQNRELSRLGIFDRYAKDILSDKFYVALERGRTYLWVILGSWGVFCDWICRRIGDGRGVGRGVPDGRERPGVGRVRAHGCRLAYHLVGKFRDASLGVSQLPDR